MDIESQAGAGDRSTTSLDFILLQAKGTDSLSVASSSVSSYQGPHVGSEDQSKKHSRKSISPSNVQLDRAFTKDGVCNLRASNVERRKEKFLQDIFTTLVELQWRWTLLILCLSYFASWLGFAVFWYLIVYLHNDIDNFGREGWDACVANVETFTNAFLFSVETQHTTGYGYHHLTGHCPQAVVLFCCQSIFGVILDGFMVGLVFLKMARPKNRTETIMFSRNALINVRDGVLCFMFRVADMRVSHLLEAHVRAQIVRKRTTANGEIVSYHQEELNVSGEGEKDDRILTFWPTTVVHKITQDSPLRGLMQMDLNIDNNSFEIIVVLEGIVEATGMAVQARSSYLPSEILWGFRFANLTSSKTPHGHRTIDYSKFHEAIRINMEKYEPQMFTPMVNRKLEID